ncbi:MAG: hypothetical protein ABSF83_12975 [Nitrososphaerales archaeon]|jgi:hypothetical protein
MGNSIPGTATKLLTLVPILVVVYYHDFPSFLTTLSSPVALTTFVATLSLLILGVVLKRRILAVRLELSKVSFGWGLILLSLAVVLYVYGSYSVDTVWFHYESLYVLIVGYIAIRIGGSVLRALAPLLAIFSLSVPPLGLFPDSLHHELLVLLAADLVLCLFFVYVKLRWRSMMVPLGIVAIASVGSYASLIGMTALAQTLDVLIPVPFFAFVIPAVRRQTALPRSAPTAGLDTHEHRLFPSGFCSVCGSKVSRARNSENVGLWGLLAVLAVAALLLFTSIPALAMSGGVPQDVHYSAQGASVTGNPGTPPGWVVNSTAPEGLREDAYSVTQVYVPLYHPETKNYTVDYELSIIDPPVANGPFGQDIPGWNRLSNVFTQFGPFHGYLSAYVAADTVMITYHGVTPMIFLNGMSFQQFFVGLGFVREFKNSNVTADTTQFLNDLKALWLPLVNTAATYSGWMSFLSTNYEDGQAAGAFALLISSVCVIGLAAYRASLLDDKLDRFLSVAATQNGENWSNLTRLLRLPHHAGTGQELGLARTSSRLDVERLDSSLRELEQRDLVRASLAERGADLVSVWRAAV